MPQPMPQPVPMPNTKPALRPATERFFDPEGEAARVARLAGEGDVAVVSPVHRLQHELAIFEQGAAMAGGAQVARRPDLYPGWFRVGFPIGASALLWAAIAWGIRALW